MSWCYLRGGWWKGPGEGERMRKRVFDAGCVFGDKPDGEPGRGVAWLW